MIPRWTRPRPAACVLLLAAALLSILFLRATPSTAADPPAPFTDIAAGLPAVSESAAVWGDYDANSDLDVLIAGIPVRTRSSRPFSATRAAAAGVVFSGEHRERQTMRAPASGKGCRFYSGDASGLARPASTWWLRPESPIVKRGEGGPSG
jgi:hypothetical protein